MGDKTPLEKMRFKAGMRPVFLGTPKGMESALGLPAGTVVIEDPAAADFVLAFVSSQAEAEEQLLTLKPHIGPKSLVWVAYPKGSRAAGRDLNRDSVWRFAATIGLALVANVAIDDTWSALRIRPAA